MSLQRITIFVEDDNDPTNYEWVVQWLERWKEDARVADYSTGGWEHLWDIEASDLAVAEVPKGFLCSSVWTSRPRAGAHQVSMDSSPTST